MGFTDEEFELMALERGPDPADYVPSGYCIKGPYNRWDWLQQSPKLLPYPYNDAKIQLYEKDGFHLKDISIKEFIDLIREYI